MTTTTTTTASRAYFFQVHDRITCCRIPGAHSIDAEDLTTAIAKLPANWIPWEALVERGNQLTRVPNQTLLDACRAAGKYRS